jgi:putative flippase GtrA
VFKQFFAHLPHAQLLRYLAIGAWNTLFGYACYFLLVRLFLHILPTPPSLTASIALVVATLINITVSFLGYKWFVFRTKGHYWREYLRSMTVYLPSLLLNAALIAPLTAACRMIHSIQEKAPYIAGALLTGFTVILSFFGHKHISFKSREANLDRPSVDS